MHYYSTKNKELKFGLKEALLKGLAPDGGLFMPSHIPILTRDELEGLRDLDLTGIALKISEMLFGEDIPSKQLTPLVEEAINFDTPLVQVEENLYSLELFHGPTLAFKDVGARFLARLLGYYTQDMDDEIHVLVATSGDTGSAVASGFLDVPGIKVHVLYPSGLVSPLQEKQFTTLGKNISAVEVKGSFDDCQKLVKEAFMDKELIRSNDPDFCQFHQPGPLSAPGILLFQSLGPAGIRQTVFLFCPQWKLWQYDSRTGGTGNGIACTYLSFSQ